MREEKFLGTREIEHDSFSNYRQHYPGRRKSNNTWKYRIERFARFIPQRTAMIQGERSLNWDQFNRECNRLAHGLLRLGVRKEDRVAISGFNSIEWMEAYFASSKIGAVPVNINPRFVPDEVRYILEDSDAVAVFVEEDYAEAVAEIRDRLPQLKQAIVYGIGKRPDKVPEDMLVYDDVKTLNESNPRVRVYNDDFCFLMYTGGTTGYPKGTVWDGEQRVYGLDMIMCSGIIPVIDRIFEFPEGALRGYISLITSRERVIETLTRFFTRERVRGFLASQANKDLTFRLFKAISGKPLAIKIMSLLQKDGIRVMPACPLFHGAGYEADFGHIAAQGATSVFLPTPHPFDARELWETVEREKVHNVIIVGDAFAIPMLEELKRAKGEGRVYDASSLFGMFSSGVRWSPHIKRELLEYAPGMLVLDEMGTSESSAAFTEMTTSADEEIKLAGAKLSKVAGGIYEHEVYACRVIDPETGENVEPGSGKIGEFVYGGWMALGYWKCPKKTAQDFRVVDGKRWFFVGDRGTLDSDGKFNLIGRGGDYLINTGGEKVYSEEVESMIKTHPKVRDVAVVGVPDPRWGQAVTALVDLVPGESAAEDEIIDYCREHMAGYKRPHHVFFVENVPRSASGKVDRAMALSMLAEKLKEGEELTSQ
jgi:acyl-CoA synthetase (AMP-forming)/AMP-acid ligase II